MLFFVLLARIPAIAPVNKAIAIKRAVFNENPILRSNIIPIINDITAYRNAVSIADRRLLHGFFLAAIELPEKTPSTVAAIAEGNVYISGKSVKQRSKAVINNIMKVTIMDTATAFKMPLK